MHLPNTLGHWKLRFKGESPVKKKKYLPSLPKALKIYIAFGTVPSIWCAQQIFVNNDNGDKFPFSLNTQWSLVSLKQ